MAYFQRPHDGRGLFRVIRNPRSPLPLRLDDPVRFPPNVPLDVLGTARRPLPFEKCRPTPLRIGTSANRQVAETHWIVHTFETHRRDWAGNRQEGSVPVAADMPVADSLSYPDRIL